MHADTLRNMDAKSAALIVWSQTMPIEQLRLVCINDSDEGRRALKTIVELAENLYELWASLDQTLNEIAEPSLINRIVTAKEYGMKVEALQRHFGLF